MKKYYAINVYSGDVWLEHAEATDFDAADRVLARNNFQVILSQDEMLNIFKQFLDTLKEGGGESESKDIHSDRMPR